MMATAIRTENLTKVYVKGARPAVNKLNLEVGSNTIFGFLGPNAAGKTTTINLLLGLLTPTAGRAWVLGEEIESVELKKRVGYLPENPYFYEHLTAREFLDFLGKFFPIGSEARAKKIDELLKLVGLDDVPSLTLRKFSRGMLQRIGIAQAIINDPEVVFLDEPITGLDPVGRKEVRDIIMHIKEQGKTIFFCSHVLHDVELMCDYIGILCKGELIRVGKLAEMLSIVETEISAYGLTVEQVEPLKKKDGTVILDGERVRIVIKGEEGVYDVIKTIESYGKNVQVERRKENLEEFFMREIEKVGSAEEEGSK